MSKPKMDLTLVDCVSDDENMSMTIRLVVPRKLDEHQRVALRTTTIADVVLMIQKKMTEEDR